MTPQGRSEAPELFESRVSGLLVATADASDARIDEDVQPVLRMLRERMGMDVVFVSEFAGGQRRLRLVDSARRPALLEVGMASPLATSWCQRVVDARLPEFIRDAAALPASTDLPAPPFRIGTHLSTPIILRDGTIYGTLCCFSHTVNSEVGERDLRSLRYTARLLAKMLDQQQVMVQLSRQASIAGFGNSTTSTNRNRA